MSDRVYVRTGQVQEALDRIDERAKHTMQQCDIMAYSVHNLRSRMQTDMSDFVNRETKIAEEQIFRLKDEMAGLRWYIEDLKARIEDYYQHAYYSVFGDYANVYSGDISSYINSSKRVVTSAGSFLDTFSHEHTDNISKLSKGIETLNAHISEVNHNLSLLRTKIEHAKSHLEALKTELAELEGKVRQLEEEIAQLRQEEQRARAEAAAVQIPAYESWTDSEGHQHDNSREIEAARRIREALLRQADRYAAMANEKEAEKKRLETRIQQLKTEIANVKLTIENMEQTLQKTQNHLSQTVSQRDALSSVKSSLESRKKSIEQEAICVRSDSTRACTELNSCLEAISNYLNAGISSPKLNR